MLRLGIPSDGALHEPSMRFMAACGLAVARPNPRSYTGQIRALANAVVHFQRASDITGKVEEGSIDAGIVGFDRYSESRRGGDEAVPIFDELGFGGCSLVLAVPEAWVDVSSVADLAEVSADFRAVAKDLKVATKFPKLVEQYLLNMGVDYFSLVSTSGALEAAPVMGYADMIADITSSGTTLKENRLKTVQGGTILKSQACLIVNPIAVAGNPDRLSAVRSLIDMVEGHLQAQGLYTVTADVLGESEEKVARRLLDSQYLSGLRGPTISRVYTDDGDRLFTVTVVVGREKLLEAVAYLRGLGGGSVSVLGTDYVFHGESEARRRLEASTTKGQH